MIPRCPAVTANTQAMDFFPGGDSVGSCGGEERVECRGRKGEGFFVSWLTERLVTGEESARPDQKSQVSSH